MCMDESFMEAHIDGTVRSEKRRIKATPKSTMSPKIFIWMCLNGVKDLEQWLSCDQPPCAGSLVIAV